MTRLGTDGGPPHGPDAIARTLIPKPEDLLGNARTKLNIAHVNGCLLVSAAVGWFAQSWGVFLIAMIVTLGRGLYGGEIRPDSRR